MSRSAGQPPGKAVLIEASVLQPSRRTGVAPCRIHLPPISRRQFLSGSLAAWAGLLLPRASWAADEPADPNRWALMADTHIRQLRDDLQAGGKLSAHFRQVGREILALDRRPAGAILAGDCAFMQGDTADYATLVDLVKPLRAGGIPMHFTLGNHDHHANFCRAVADQRPPREAVAAVPGKYILGVGNAARQLVPARLAGEALG